MSYFEALEVFHRHIYLGPYTPDYPREAQFADNGKRFEAAEGLDFNSLYERVIKISKKYFKIGH